MLRYYDAPALVGRFNSVEGMKRHWEKSNEVSLSSIVWAQAGVELVTHLLSAVVGRCALGLTL